MPVPILITYVYTAIPIDDKSYIEMIKRLEPSGIEVRRVDYYQMDPNEPYLYISISENERDFPKLFNLPGSERIRWLHFSKCDEVNVNGLFYCLLSATELLKDKIEIPPTKFTTDEPLVSVFTTTYKSGDRIKRPYRSLLGQSYRNWEWVILDDSDDNGATYENSLLKLKDKRIRRYRQENPCGYIGNVKRAAAGLCRGEILIEVDHDDDLSHDCLEKIVTAFKNNPNCGFAYGQCCEIYEDTGNAHWYSWDYAYGYGLYWRQHIKSQGRWHNVSTNNILNHKTVSHLIGLPNHPRAWTRNCYFLVGGHRSQLSVSDDFDLLIRTFLCTNYVGIPHLLYMQYRNAGGSNFTFIRNGHIQTLCEHIYRYYEPRINKRLEELGISDCRGLGYARIWECKPDDPRFQTRLVIDYDPHNTSTILISKDNVMTDVLAKNFDFNKGELIIVGNIPSTIESLAKTLPDGKLRWWQMEKDFKVNHAEMWAKMIRSCEKFKIIHC